MNVFFWLIGLGALVVLFVVFKNRLKKPVAQLRAEAEAAAAAAAKDVKKVAKAVEQDLGKKTTKTP